MQIIAPTSIWLIVKIFFIVGLAVYLIFALVIVRQIEIMTQTVKLEFELPIKILGILHLIFALVLLIFALIVL
ncbi:MAG TPA: DUF5657 family protein [Candidatus Saccharimonadales bacterium]|nr:DUF5657 family protein [Candidatus Saccharimonadales bacterium]